MKVLVTGATGFVGGAIAEELAKRGHAIRALARHAAKAGRLRELGAEFTPGDIAGPATFAGALRGCDAVIHLVGIIQEKGKASFQRIHVDGTANVLQAAKAAGVRKFVHMSALGANPHGTAYHRTKYEAEVLVKGSGICYAIFRPSIIVGRESPVMRLWVRMIRRAPVVPVLGDGRYRLQVVALRDVARAFVEAAEREDLRDATFELVGPEKLSYDEILDVLAAALGKRVRKAHIPLGVVSPAVRFAAALRLPAPITPDQLRMLLEENIAEGEGNALREVFGIEPLSFRDVVREVA
ncbi:MAG: complex I NDUFA9 subunit family protein [Gemmatimonadetes bacterium]|nr:complex I NDUFA9 subunit family protein [Gemmatimonadota bacterium]